MKLKGHQPNPPAQASSIRVVVADGSPVMLRALQSVLATDDRFDVVGTSANRVSPAGCWHSHSVLPIADMILNLKGQIEFSDARDSDRAQLRLERHVKLLAITHLCGRKSSGIPSAVINGQRRIKSRE